MRAAASDCDSRPLPQEYMKALDAASRLLRLRRKWVYDLLDEPDDWSFVIKAHALVESYITQLLLNRLNRPEITRQVASLPVHLKQKMLERICPGIFESADRRVLQILRELRNKLVHNVNETGFTFKRLRQKDPAAAATFDQDFAAVWPSSLREAGLGKIAAQGTRLVVWMSLMLILAQVQSRIDVKAGSDYQAYLKLLLGAIPPKPVQPVSKGDTS